MRPRHGRARAARRACLIVCEGANTEPVYFKLLVRTLGLAATVDVEVHGAPGATDPDNLVAFALKRRRERAREARQDITRAEFEEVWIVFDTEGRTHHRAAAIPGAVQKALAQGLKVAVSRPSFEVWFILHDRATPPGLTDGDAAIPVLTGLLKSAYDKERAVAETTAAWSMPRTAKALAHAARQSCFTGDGAALSAHVPSSTGTGVHRLVEVLVAMSSDDLAKARLGFSPPDRDR